MLSESDEIAREVFVRHLGGVRQLDTASDADLTLTSLRGGFDIMRFRLVFEGELPSGSYKSQSPKKWAVREQFRPQLASLSATHPTLRGVGFKIREPMIDRERTEEAGWLGRSPSQPERKVEIASPHADAQHAVLSAVQVGNYRFIPLVRDALALTCSLDILFLRNDFPGSVVQGGDLDNRLKILFDGLRMPSADELKGHKPSVDPFYCLLEDDRQISSFSVTTDRLLTDPTRESREVKLIIEVKISAIRLTSLNVGFLSD